MDFPSEELRGFYKNNNEIVPKKAELAMTLMEPGKYEEVKINLQAKLNFSKVHFFGSRLLGLANGNSDLDLFVETGNAECKMIISVLNFIDHLFRQCVLGSFNTKCS